MKSEVHLGLTASGNCIKTPLNKAFALNRYTFQIQIYWTCSWMKLVIMTTTTIVGKWNEGEDEGITIEFAGGEHVSDSLPEANNIPI